LIAETGRVVGDLSAPRIGMSEGAHVRGSVRTDGAAAPSSASRATSQRAAEPRPSPPPVERPALRPVAAAPVAAAQSAASPVRPVAKKPPPPPVIHAPRPGVRARKKMSRR
jgi:hypothetical protein